MLNVGNNKFVKDPFGRKINYLRLSLTSQCNLHCAYCFSEKSNFVKENNKLLTDQQILNIARIAVELGIEKIRLTGGEPLLRNNLIALCENIHKLEKLKALALTTNGILLPKYLNDLVSVGLNQINISIDSLDPKRYCSITHGGKLTNVLRAIEQLLKADFCKIKLNTVLIKNFNDDPSSIQALVELTRNNPIELRFIELMPMSLNIFSQQNFCSCEHVLKVLEELYGEVTYLGLVGTAEILQLPHFMGKIGLISPLSHKFCSSCNRIRITSDGYVLPCLHSARAYNIANLETEELKLKLSTIIQNKPQAHRLEQYKSEANRIMCAIGG